MSRYLLWGGTAIVLVAFLGWMTARVMASCAPWCQTRTEMAEAMAVGVLVVGVAGIVALICGCIMRATERGGAAIARDKAKE